ncbi:hypothetical protein L0U85_10910 [Glycomyces sp. L485]|uniref:hypothetical protein n=1 Tax=Glycomyces sp. L485 TaxID=2909235 RepID=UPI001F4B62DA|nr:hypothetical protein [Glycomyces sp. L485]MCH7231354.1 hypothetical protein [Glycomyces sp. L485]
MDPLAIVALQLMNQEAHSALPNAPVVDDSPSLFSRLVGSVASARRGMAGRLVRDAAPAIPQRADVRRAA